MSKHSKLEGQNDSLSHHLNIYEVSHVHGQYHVHVSFHEGHSHDDCRKILFRYLYMCSDDSLCSMIKSYENKDLNIITRLIQRKSINTNKLC